MWMRYQFSSIRGGHGCPVGRALSSRPKGPSSRLACETPPCTLMTAGAYKTCLYVMSFKFSFNMYLGGYQSGGAIPSVVDQNCDSICLWTILRYVFQIVGNSPLRCSNPTLNTTLPTYLFYAEMSFNFFLNTTIKMF